MEAEEKKKKRERMRKSAPSGERLPGTSFVDLQFAV